MKNAIIETSNLMKTYEIRDSKLTVLDNINLKIYEEDFTVIMGRSGSGKSTLLYCLSFMDKISSGKVLLDGKEYKHESKQLSKLYSEDISFVFQSSNLLPDLTAYENIAYPGYLMGSKMEVNSKTKDAIRKLNLAKIEDHHPNEMSGGEIQRVAIARALLKKPKVLFADEPTGALNSVLGEQVLDLFTQANEEGQTIIMVTHDIKASLRANRILYLADGKVSAELELGEYSEDNLEEREHKVYTFLQELNW